MESTFHLGILRERLDVNVVLHFQSEYATAVSCMKNKPANFNVTAEIPCHVGSEIPVIPYYRPGSPELAKAVVEAMQKHNSVFTDQPRTSGVRKKTSTKYTNGLLFSKWLVASLFNPAVIIQCSHRQKLKTWKSTY